MSNSNNSSAASTPKRRARGRFGVAKRNGVATQTSSTNKPRGETETVLDLPTIRVRAQECFRKQQHERAVGWWEKGAQRRDAQCLYNLGCCFQNGWGVEKRNAAEAVAKYTEAGRMNHPQALYNLALCFVHGDGTYRDIARAIALLKQAAQLGHTNASFNAAQLLLASNMPPSQPRGIAATVVSGNTADNNDEKHEKDAVEAEARSPPAASTVVAPGGVGGHHHQQREKDVFADAMACLKQASDHGHPEAAHSLGLCYMAGGPGVEPNEQRAFECFQRAAQAGCVEALYHLGICYELGQVSRDV